MSAANKHTESRAVWIRVIEWGLVIVIVGGAAGYLLWKPLNPMADPKAARALALVQTHQARTAPTIRQAIDTIMRENAKSGRTASMSDWSVQRNNRTQDRNGYLVRVEVRLPGDQSHRWIEWEYLWLVGLTPESVTPLSRPAAEVMP